MKTIYDILIDSPFKNFKEWKYYLRHHDITCDVVNLLDGVPQSTHYHPEYDALKHTYYVCKASLEMGPPLLLEAAFLHDVGKSFTTNIGNRRIYHFGHSEKSLEFIDKIKHRLKYYDETYRLVKLHMNSNVKNDRNLEQFIYADKRLSKRLYEIEHYPTLFINNWSNKLKEKFIHFKQRHASKVIYITIAPSGLGKTTYLNKKFPSEIIVSPDEIRKELTGNVSDQILNNEVWILTKIRMKINLVRYNKCVLDATNVNKFLRIHFMSNFNDCKKVSIVFNGSYDGAIKRIRTDIDNGVNRSNVLDDIVKKQFKMFYKGYKSIFSEFNKVIFVDFDWNK